MESSLESISIRKLGLSTRARNSLLQYGVETFGEMYEIAMAGKLNNLRNMGKITINEIMNKITEMYKNKDAVFDRIKLKKQFEQASRDIEKVESQLKELEKKRDFLKQQIELLNVKKD